MAHFDVFNGDADGICALHQLRLARPREATLITGVKRDTELVARVPAHRGDTLTVLDISFDSNREALTKLLDQDIRIEYFDHHYAGDLPQTVNLIAHIDTTAQVCTSVLVDRHLAGRYRTWAITAAFGDNLGETAQTLATQVGLTPAQTDQLRDLGDSINYNAYGDTVEDLIIAPQTLYETLKPYADPFDFIAAEPVVQRLAECRKEDLALAQTVTPLIALQYGSVFVLPDAPWTRRVRGVFGNALATGEPTRAHAVLTTNTDGTYTVSVRAPLASPRGADELCRAFPGGNGRVGAAGINSLEHGRLDAFVTAFARVFGRTR
ncbi:MAG: acetyltransferase [Paraburkholderia sp.]|uniref:acetyltransferase n=1 Tax=Paraburkholderia sp. TaxID=1926495 RepID=UPI001213674E|nr:acetyltransferase [Paraburkholderia sp.]TAM05280.1 MAG: acetyltransferase [Paraburkholderia sp.]TAM30921.1 MAG: acetyltransferase [Paraburkholderia sp.]